jgi:hypothetical protein
VVEKANEKEGKDVEDGTEEEEQQEVREGVASAAGRK